MPELQLWNLFAIVVGSREDFKFDLQGKVAVFGQLAFVYGSAYMGRSRQPQQSLSTGSSIVALYTSLGEGKVMPRGLSSPQF